KLVRVVAHQLAVAVVGQKLFYFQIGYVTFVDHDVRLEVKDLFEIAKRDVEQMSNARWQALEEPYVRAGRRELNMSETLATNLALCHLDTALIADHAAVFHPLVLSAQTFPVRNRSENSRAEQTVTLRLEGAIVDRFRLCDLAVRPRTNLFR